MKTDQIPIENTSGSLNISKEALKADFKRPRSALRMTYETEAALIQKQLGNLEDIRKKLGLSKRRMCQLLLVDPSAWTRWTQSKRGAPPHIYRALEWYLKSLEGSRATDLEDSFGPLHDSRFQQMLGKRPQQSARGLKLWKALLVLNLLLSLFILTIWTLGGYGLL